MNLRIILVVCSFVAVGVLAIVLFAGTRPDSAGAAFPGVNGKIAFYTLIVNEGDNPEIYVINPDGSDLTNLTNSPAADGAAAWSPDGTKIVFSSDRDGDHEIYVMNGDGSGHSRLTSILGLDTAPSWSPDGSQIVFVSYRGGDAEIYLMNSDGSNPANLTNSPTTYDLSPEWSPDGSQIVFNSNPVAAHPDPPDINQSDIYVMNADGSGRTNLTDTPMKSEGGPNWSPDGFQIVFWGDDSEAGWNDEIYVMNADGSGRLNVTNFPDADDIYPAWSPDGTKIVFVSRRDNNEEIYMMNADGGGQTRVTNSAASEAWPDWQPLVDTDLDGCTDNKELGTNEATGGGRDPLYYWDFVDQWTGSPFQRDRLIVGGDIGAVVARFGTIRGTAPTQAEALAEALTPPVATTGYHASADRGGSLDGNPIHLAPPDGSIVAGDIGAVVAQFGHNCS